MDVDSGKRLPVCHCAFRGCGATTSYLDPTSHWSSEKWLFEHLKACHADKEMLEVSQARCQGARHESEMTLLAYYMAAVRARERDHMPLLGPSVDRRSLAMVNKLCQDSTVQALVCCICAQVHTHASCWQQMWKEPHFKGNQEEIRAKRQQWYQAPCNNYREWSQCKIRMI